MATTLPRFAAPFTDGHGQSLRGRGHVPLATGGRKCGPTGLCAGPRPRTQSTSVSRLPEPSVPTVSVMVVRPVVATLASFGVHVPTLLARAGISEADLKDKSARVPVARELALWRAADELTGDPALGLRLAAQFEPGVLGSLGYMLRHSQNLAQLLARAQRFCGLMDDLAQVGLEVDGPLARISFARSGGYPVPSAGVESLFAIAFATGHSMWPEARATSVCFAHRRRAEAETYRVRFGCPVHFDAGSNSIAFDAAWLDVSAQNTDPRLGRLLEAHSEHLLAQLPKPHGLVEAARASLRSGLGQRKATPDELARALHLSERTLRRRLALEGTSYQALLDEVRRALALTLVLRSDLSFAQMAEQLGFADASTYYRAFKRWTGTTPREYQKQRGE
jgi:AraC-like DNA-binding protein